MKSFRELFIRDLEAGGKETDRQKLYDPGGWGRCVCPLFAVNDAEINGWGTGFFVKGLPLGITAEHLLDIGSYPVPAEEPENERYLDLQNLDYGLATIIPSQSIIFGTHHIPQEYSQPVRRFAFDLTEKPDPLANLKGNRRFSRKSDVMMLEFFDDAPLPPDDWLPRISRAIPTVGDWVCAVGFPDIRLRHTRDFDITIFQEGMALSFAKVTQVEMAGRGEYENTPVAFAESDWPSGMSGGPVFNDRGRVVGVVSREAIGCGKPLGSFTLLAPVLDQLGPLDD